MHDFLLAKEITDKLLEIAGERKPSGVRSVTLEIGSITYGDHTEEINLENLEFGLQNIVQNTALRGVKFNVKKTEGDSWKITDIEVK